MGDLKEHEESSTCECMPKVITENDTIICVHNAFDNRVFIEQLCQEINEINEAKSTGNKSW